MKSIFLTGFPGFLASAILPRLMVREPDDVGFDCVVERRFLAVAEQRVAAMPELPRSRVRLHAGDITLPDLGLGPEAKAIQRRCREIFHFAAVYDLAVPKDTAYAVNVQGTSQLLAFADGATELRRLHHVSTCYVSGSHRGLFKETDLDRGQDFRNYYEETKYVSEKLVQGNILNDCTTTIYRPSIVAGDSRTGRAQKMDGLYYFIQWLLAQPRMLAIMPRIAASQSHTLNVVPCDFVIAAIDYLSGRKQASQTVYHLCDPEPPTIKRLVRLLASGTDRRVIEMPLPAAVARGLLRAACAMHPRLSIPSAAISYLAHPAQYDTTHAQRDLASSGLTVPDVAEYLSLMVDFVRGYTQ